VALGACGGGGDSKSTTTDKGSGGTTANRAPVTITLWNGFTNRELGVVKQAVDAFHQSHPWITVKVVGGVNDDKIIAAIRGGNSPDVAQSFTADNTGLFCSSGGWIDLKPYLDVAANLAFPLKMARVKGAERDRRVRETAELLDLTPYLQRKPAQLSGGQRQRVAMGRAIIREPAVFLMDEPLSNLDAKLRVQMRAEIASLQSRLEVTTVFVTHDRVEAMTMGHRVAVLRDGRLQQCDTPRRLYDHPANVFVAGFIGSPAMNLCTLAVVDGRAELGGRELALPTVVNGAREVVVGLRPESLELADDGLPGRVEVVEELGADAYAFCVAQLPSGEVRLVARADARHPPASGDRVALRPRFDEAHLFDPVSGTRLGE
jgi:multiple sugar transport system ATP-binding protein